MLTNRRRLLSGAAALASGALTAAWVHGNAGNGAPWYQQYAINGVNPVVAIDFTQGLYYDGVGTSSLSALVSGAPTVTAGSTGGMLCNGTGFTANGALLTALQAAAFTVRADTFGGTNFSVGGIVGFGALAPLFENNNTNALMTSNTGTINSINIPDWSKANTCVCAADSSGSRNALNGELTLSGTGIFNVTPTAVQLGSFNGGDAFGGYIQRLFVYNFKATAPQLQTASLPGPSGGGGLFFPSLTSNSYVDVGSHSVLQWERTQPWTMIAFINVSVPSVSFNYPIIFTTVGTTTPTFPGYEVFLDYTTGFLHCRILSSFSGSNWLGVQGSVNLCDGVSRIVGVTYDGSSSAAGVKFYYGAPGSVVQDTGTTVELNALSGSIVNTQHFIIGNQLNTNFSLQGALGSFYLSSDNVPAATIEAYTTAAALNTARPSTTQLAYDFLTGSGTSATDVSQNGFTGTLTGTVYWQNGTLG